MHPDEDNHFARGHAFGADDIASRTRYVEHPAKTLFLIWVTLTEQKWVIFGECRGHRQGRESWITRNSEPEPAVRAFGLPRRRSPDIRIRKRSQTQ
jgi:hypothetical protein